MRIQWTANSICLRNCELFAILADLVAKRCSNADLLQHAPQNIIVNLFNLFWSAKITQDLAVERLEHADMCVKRKSFLFPFGRGWQIIAAQLLNFEYTVTMLRFALMTPSLARNGMICWKLGKEVFCYILDGALIHW